LRYCYRGWRPTRFGRWVNRLAAWFSTSGLASRELAVLEVPGRISGQIRRTPVVIATVRDHQYLVSMLGEGSDWIKNVEAARGVAVLRQKHARRARLVRVSEEERAPILREYVRVATSGRQHFPVSVDAPLSEYQAIASHYPVYRIESDSGNLGDSGSVQDMSA
jgi:deazaflavin-dependent oxidoreductase (nitroreductase family)